MVLRFFQRKVGFSGVKITGEIKKGLEWKVPFSIYKCFITINFAIKHFELNIIFERGFNNLMIWVALPKFWKFTLHIKKNEYLSDTKFLRNCTWNLQKTA